MKKRESDALEMRNVYFLFHDLRRLYHVVSKPAIKVYTYSQQAGVLSQKRSKANLIE